MNYTLINLALFVYSLILASVLLFFNYYSLIENQTNHTGIPIEFLAVVYFLTFITSIIMMIINRKELLPNKRKTHYLLLGLITISFIAFINIFAFDQLNIMMSYEAWLHKGMPDKPTFLR